MIHDYMFLFYRGVDTALYIISYFVPIYRCLYIYLFTHASYQYLITMFFSLLYIRLSHSRPDTWCAIDHHHMTWWCS